MPVEKKYYFRFVVIMTGFMGVVLLTYRDGVVGSLFADFSVRTAQATLMLLHCSGIDAVRAANQIFHPGGFVYEICYRCTGLLPMAFFTTAVLAHRAPLRFKIAALVGGLPILIAINLTRLVHLFHVGVHHRGAFDFAHLFLWQPIMVLVTFGMWYGWTRLVAKRA
jgi:exosortase/archaeosortase family protein